MQTISYISCKKLTKICLQLYRVLRIGGLQNFTFYLIEHEQHSIQLSYNEITGESFY
jgi:hypothetical protein